MNFSNIPTEWLMAFWIANTVFSALVQSLIPPDTNSSKAYIVFYKFINLLIADFKTFSAQVPPPTFQTTTGASTKTVTDVIVPTTTKKDSGLL